MKIGVIVGRFQCQKLTEGHKYLIRNVASKCDKLIIFVGVYPLKPNFNNPLPYELREWMLYEFIPHWMLLSKRLQIVPIVDVFNIPLWSSNLDEKIKELTVDADEVMLYGGRNSFIKNYVGKYPTKEIPSNGVISTATELREEIKKMDIHGSDESFRKGIIWSLRNEA